MNLVVVLKVEVRGPPEASGFFRDHECLYKITQ